MLKKVVEVLYQYYNIEIIDTRQEGKEISYGWNGIELRDYQKEAVQKALQFGSGYICMPTGAGKTVVALRIIYELKRSALILVHRKELLYQWRDAIARILSVPPAQIGLVGDNNFKESFITVAMVQTLYRRPLTRHYDILITDECHHIPADTFFQVASEIGAKYRFGLSATPWREDGRDMMIRAQLGPLISYITVERMVQNGWLAKPKFVIVVHSQPPARWDDWKECYDNYILNGKQRNRAIVKIVKKLYQLGHKIYVDVRYIRHGELLEQLLRNEKVPAVFISGRESSERRQAILKRFESDGFVLISTLIKEGVDLPKMSAIILAGGGRSSVQVIQTIGRSLRPKVGSNEAIVVDFYDRGKYVGEHFKQRQKVLREYYGELYKPTHVQV